MTTAVAPLPNRRVKAASTPSLSQIAHRAQHIRSEWTPEQKQSRSVRRDAADQRFQAHLRFLQMLMTDSPADS